MADHRAATQTRYPWRATIRSVLQFGLPLAGIAPEIYQAATLHDPATATGWTVTALAIAGGITRVMNLPGVNAALTKIGLGAEPKNPA